MSITAPLNGCRVLDVTHMVAGPYCTMMLADMGADVVKLERPGGGDEMRTVGPYEGRSSDDEDAFYMINRGKRSVVLDLKTDEGRRTVLDMAKAADVCVQNLSPSRSAELGIHPERVMAANPRLVYCSISGFGLDGACKDYPAVNEIIQAMSGLMSLSGEPDGPPSTVATPVVDVVAGMFAAYAIVSAYLRAQRTGVGAHVDISLLDSMLAVMSPEMAEPLQLGRQPERVGSGHPLRVPGGRFVCKDGRMLMFMTPNERFWPQVCAAFNRTEWEGDPRFATMTSRVQNRSTLHELVSDVLQERAAEEWVERLRSRRVPAGLVNTAVEAINLSCVVQRGLIVSMAHPKSGTIRMIAPPWQLSHWEPTSRPPPLLGQHTGEVLEEWLDSE